MHLRPLILSDLNQINEIWERCHKGKMGIPRRDHFIIDAVVENENKLKGYGIARHFTEALLYLDKDLSKFQQAKAFKLLLEKCIEACKNSGLDQLNVGVNDPIFADILRRKYNFQNRDHQVLFLEV